MRTDWDPVPPAEVHELFAALAAPWWLAGGYAVEQALGRSLREHGDIDVLVLRRDHLAVQQVLRGWEWWAADPPGALRPWQSGEILPAEVCDVWCRPAADRPWRIQLMIDESDGECWTSRRNPRVRREVRSIGRTGASGIPYLAPEILLFYKAKDTRPKDEADFAALLPLLTPGQRRWLAEAIGDTYGAHPWLAHASPG
ncbi:Aminoglycoside-2''-adenylyltransferase [Saccharopolyspora antimicrobica]|uniref:Aminoglycoside-2''-adenylyltransferase n=1 Tax=Saccharopolyspora antimicrobica TaxID=455193 RepID=A0A1I5HFR4_9PSEU|nr:amino acid transporter [Saccharopolyspora antimicrobica]RKT85331.1 aminoglycoside-2''-adenylyltransferase [Saccharopolyspora antimicrobica]SFO46816.1 Aminoglycoside-2''-adenylyltransferase [Saccharopolyspora antimicrobica]